MKIPQLILLLSVFYASSAAAINCYEKSPNYEANEKDYFNLDNSISIKKSEEKTLSKLVKDLKGKWIGSIEETTCFGPDRAPRLVTKLADSKTTFKDSKFSFLKIESQKKYPSTGVSRSDTIELLSKKNIFSLQLSAQGFTATERFRMTSNSRSRHIEAISHVKKHKKNITIEVIYYTNGVLTHTVSMNLSKR